MFRRQFHYKAADRELSRLSLYWLLATLSVALLLHLVRLPLWLVLLVASLLGWRLYLLATASRPPAVILKTVLALAALAIFALANGRSFTVETAIGFFVMTYGLKLLELHTTRDAFLFAFLSMFLITLAFLFGQDLFNVMLVFAALLLPLHALKSMQQVNNNRKLTTRGLVGTARLVMVALPLLVVFYVLFPRIGPLWSMPLKTSSGFTGLSESMTPGQIADLANSSERAFRVSFNDRLPQPAELYWQAIILDQFDGHTWSRSVFQQNRDAKPARTGPYNDLLWKYEILLDPHNQNWGFTLRHDEVIMGDPGITADGLVRFHKPVKAPKRYRQGSAAQLVVALDERTRWRLTRLPPDSNPATLAWVDWLRSTHSDDEAMIRALLDHFRREPYFYSLQAPLLKSAHRIDEFLFVTRKGFCEHFASSMAFSLRVAGIPSRIMTGYQGGEWNAQGGFLVVHQYDAHAWVEAWLDGKGWVSVDPTAAVAPDRIERGIREALAAEGSFLQNEPLSLARFNHLGLVSWIRMQLEYTNYLWQDWVVNYDRDRQTDLFSAWLGDNSIQRGAILLGGMAVAVFLLMGLAGFWPASSQQKVAPLVKLVYRYEKRLLRAGLDCPPGLLTLAQITLLACNKWPAEKAKLLAIASDLEQLIYGSTVDGVPVSQRLKQIKVQITQLRLKRNRP
jgi:transglutaminase-like putative cysteine protease